MNATYQLQMSSDTLSQMNPLFQEVIGWIRLGLQEMAEQIPTLLQEAVLYLQSGGKITVFRSIMDRVEGQMSAEPALFQGIGCLIGAVLPGIVFLVLSWRWVRIYNNDGFGNYRYAGSLLLRRQDGTWLACLPEKTVWEAMTDSYCLKPPFLFCLLCRSQTIRVENPRNDCSRLLQTEREMFCTLWKRRENR